LLYAAFGGEADLAAVAAEAARQGKTVAYPVCGEGFSLTAAVPGADGWAVGQYGIHAPVLERSTLLQPEQLDLVLVPCTAAGWAWARATTTATCPAAPGR
jgi:5-formyltetrahydrofolate cyclo-ligase